ncbi:MAG: methionyl-tRNA formyltransferase [Flavobacterium sp.]|jgi:methionyl-tRNA formyltransferase
MSKLKIIFMGTPDFAVGILQSVLQNEYEVVGVITAADKPAGRGQKIKYSAVKNFALDKGLHLLQPTSLKDPLFLEELANLNANLQIVVAFRMLPEVVWKMPSLGTFNLHASLLPNYRGAAPINWAIINGETKTGVTTFFIDDKIDTGAMILKKEIPINEEDTIGTLHDKLMLLGTLAVNETLKLIETDQVKLTMQTAELEIKTAYKLNKENCKIDFKKSGEEIRNLIRGLNPYPAAWCFIKNESVETTAKIFDVALDHTAHNLEIGTIITSKKELKIALENGFLQVKSIQLSGKRQLKTEELLNGMLFSKDSKAY